MMNETTKYGIFNNYSNINVINLTHVNDTYVINILERFPKVTFIQSFILTFFTLLGDETFILLILLKQQFAKSHLIFFSFLLAILGLNTINVLFGRSLDLLLYQSFIDIFAIIIFGIIGIGHFLRFFDRKNRLNYLQEIKKIIKPDSIINEEEEDDINCLLINKDINQNDLIQKSNEYENKEDYIYDKYYEGHNKGYLIWIFGKTVFISIFGDSYMFGIISNSAISNFKGTLFGSSLAIIIIVYLACYHGIFIGSKLSQGKMGVIISFIFFWFAAEIFYLSIFLNE